MTASSDIFGKQARLGHQHFVQGSGYCAVIAVKTPISDDSGIAHALEHLIFRRSGSYSDPTSLFQLTSLLPLAINATTTDDTTYFHCQSNEQSLCLLGIEYLLQGICDVRLTAQDIPLEIGSPNTKGVIAQELRALDSFISCAATDISISALQASDHSDQRQYLYGGTTASVAKITLKQIAQYYAKHYQQHNITLLSSSEQPAPSFCKSIDQLLNVAATKTKAVHESVVLNDIEPSHHKVASIAVKALPHYKLKECCWWVATSIAGIEQLQEDVLSHLDNTTQWLVKGSVEPNSTGLRPLRILCKAITVDNLTTTVGAMITRYFNEPTINRDGLQPPADKFSASCDALIRFYQKAHMVAPAPKGQVVLNIRDLQFHLTPSIENDETVQLPAPLDIEAVVLPQIINLVNGTRPVLNGSSSERIPMLLQHLTDGDLKYSPRQILFSNNTDEHHYLIEFTVPLKYQYGVWCIAIILGAFAPFLTMRTQGLCYAIGAKYLPQRNVFCCYSAFSINPEIGVEHLKKSLEILTQQPHFVSEALPLAKAKIAGILTNQEKSVENRLEVVDQKEINNVINHLMSSINRSKNNN